MNYIKSIYDTEQTQKEDYQFTTVSEDEHGDQDSTDQESLPDHSDPVEYDDEHSQSDDDIDIDIEIKNWSKKLELLEIKHQYYQIESQIINMYLNSTIPDDVIVTTDLFSHVSKTVLKENNTKNNKNFFIKASKSIKDMLIHHDTLLKMSFVSNAVMSIYITFIYNYFRK